MSWSALEYVRKLQGVTATEKAVLFALAYRDDDAHKGCWPGIKSIVADTSLSINAVRKALGTAKAKGLVTITERERPDGSATSNFYQFVALAPPSQIREYPLPDLVVLEHTMNIEEEAKFRGEKWAALCASIPIVSGVDHFGYWKTIPQVPEMSIALKRLLKELRAYNPSLRLVPGSLQRLEVAAEVLADLDLDSPAFKVTLPGIDIDNPDCLQKLAKQAVDWATDIRKSYGRTFTG